jgi:hypothetical protein
VSNRHDSLTCLNPNLKIMRTLKFLLAFALLPLASCDDNSERPDIDFEEFTLKVPENWRHETLQGYDSKVAKFVTQRGEDITYDLGLWSYSLSVDSDTHYITLTTIDGKDAKIVRPKKSGQGTTGVYFGNLGGGNRFQMSGINLSTATEAMLLSAIETLHFK